jgi:hypothetical protein
MRYWCRWFSCTFQENECAGVKRMREQGGNVFKRQVEDYLQEKKK